MPGMTAPTATTREARKVRVSARSWFYATGTQAWADRDRPERQDAEDRATSALLLRIAAAPARKDGSRTVELSAEDRDVLLDYASAWVLGAVDNAGPDDPDATADLNALRALIRHLSA